MKPIDLTTAEIAERIGAKLEGDGQTIIHRLLPIDLAEPGDLTFAVDQRRARHLNDCHATAAIVSPVTEVPTGMIALRTEHPAEAVARILALAADPDDVPPAGIHPSATIAPTAKIGTNVAIGPNTVVGENAVVSDNAVLAANVCVGADVYIGEQSVLLAGVIIQQGCQIGKRCRIHPSTVIGADGFGYYHRDGVHHKVPHVGTVELGDDVEIGANTCVDRGKFGPTRIGNGSKIDNHVQVAHNVQIGRGVLVAGMTGIAGSAKIEDYVVIGGHCGIKDNITIGAGTMIAAYSAVPTSIGPGLRVGGVGATPEGRHVRAMALYGKIPEMWDMTRKLQKRLDALEKATKNDQPTG